MQKVKIKMQSDRAKVKKFAFWVVILIFEFLYGLGFGAWDLGFRGGEDKPRPCSCPTGPDKSGNYKISRREGILSFAIEERGGTYKMPPSLCSPSPRPSPVEGEGIKVGLVPVFIPI